MKIMLIVGARPNFMKAMPILAAIQERNRQQSNGDRALRETEKIRPILVHTGQHYDRLMSDQFFSDLYLPKPDFHLGVGSGTHAQQTAEIMRRFEEILMSERPDIVVLVGDVNSTLACALVASKVAFDEKGARPLIAHVEAGLRSFDKSMPEEINRIVTDHVSDLLFVTEESGALNLEHEGIPSEKIHFVGNTMIDSLFAFRDRADESPILDKLGLRAEPRGNGKPSDPPYALLTLHRPSNVDLPDAFQRILQGLLDLSQKMQIIFPLHPRTRRRIQEFGFDHNFGTDAKERGGVRMIEPLGYIDFLCLMKNARLVLTDSGGVQEETTCLGVACVTIRENTERPITVTHGTNVIAGTSSVGIKRAIAHQLTRKTSPCMPEKWDGKAAERILPILVNANHKQTPVTLTCS